MEVEAKFSIPERDTLLRLPNTPLDPVPAGGEEDNVVLAEWGEPREFGFEPLPHWEIGERLDLLDLPRGAKISGTAFPVMRGRGAAQNRS